MSINRYQVTKKISIISAMTNSLLALVKIVVGIFGHSYALVADGLHSISDVITDGLVLIAAKAGDEIPDKDHPYGHQRIETIATVIIAMLLISIAVAIVYNAIPNFLHHVALPQPSNLVLVIAFLSIITNEWLYRYTLAAGKKIQSNLLISNAWHNRSDAFVSLIVLLSVLATHLGFKYFDSLGALIIALLIFKIGIKMIWSSVQELIDQGVDEETLSKIIESIDRVPGVVAVHQLRTRLHAGRIFVDVHIIVDPLISVSEGHHIGERVHLNLIKEFQNILDVTVHVDPEDDEKSRPSLHLPHRTEIEELLKNSWQHLPGYSEIRKINLHYLNGELSVEAFLPLEFFKNQENDVIYQYQEAAKRINEIKHVFIFFCD